MSEARTRWARVGRGGCRGRRWVSVGHWRLLGFLREASARAIGRRFMRGGEAKFRRSGRAADAARARVSTLPDYATTGVKMQAFVLFLFYIEEIRMENQSLTDKRSCAYRTRGPALGLSELHKVELGSPSPSKVALSQILMPGRRNIVAVKSLPRKWLF